MTLLYEHGGFRLVETVAYTSGTPVEPVTLAEAKLQLRIDHTEEDDLINSLIVAARMWAENFTRRSFINKSYRLSMDCWPAEIHLPRGKVSSVTSVQYVDSGGTTQTVSSSVYTLDSDSEPARLVEAYNQFWPDIRAVANAVMVTYVAGYGATANYVPDPIKAAIKLLVAHLYENREGVIVGQMPTEVPMGIKSLLGAYRLQEFF